MSEPTKGPNQVQLIQIYDRLNNEIDKLSAIGNLVQSGPDREPIHRGGVGELLLEIAERQREPLEELRSTIRETPSLSTKDTERHSEPPPALPVAARFTGDSTSDGGTAAGELELVRSAIYWETMQVFKDSAGRYLEVTQTSEGDYMICDPTEGMDFTIEEVLQDDGYPWTTIKSCAGGIGKNVARRIPGWRGAQRGAYDSPVAG